MVHWPRDRVDLVALKDRDALHDKVLRK